MDGVVLGVIAQHLLVERAKLLRRQAALRLDRAGQHHLCAAADQILRRIDRHLIEPALFQREIDGGPQIAVSVQQRAVEVETHGGEGKIAHAGASCRAVL